MAENKPPTGYPSIDELPPHTFKTEAGLHTFTLSAKEWIEKTNASETKRFSCECGYLFRCCKSDQRPVSDDGPLSFFIVPLRKKTI